MALCRLSAATTELKLYKFSILLEQSIESCSLKNLSRISIWLPTEFESKFLELALIVSVHIRGERIHRVPTFCIFFILY